MDSRRTAFSDWIWAGGPSRRLLISLLVTLVVIAVPYVAGRTPSVSLLALFVGWDLGAWFMDMAYVDRLARRKVIAG
jgi:hypothetical protein